MSKKITVAAEFEEYLKLAEFPVAEMAQDELEMLKQTYYAGFGMMLTILQENVTTLPIEKVISSYLKLDREVNAFFDLNVKKNLSP